MLRQKFDDVKISFFHIRIKILRLEYEKYIIFILKNTQNIYLL